MNLLITVLRAAHCRSTHHFFAIDALPLVSTQRGRQLQTVLLKHHACYLAGAKDPDTKFRDFRNHVVHVNDGYWGGAAEKAECWYQNLVADLDAKDWSGAAYSAGVLSHYYTDPLMPLHTAQSDIESVVHRPMEWSVVKSYERILKRWQEGYHKIVFDLPTAAGWLGQAIRRGAEVANRYYEELISHYDLESGVQTPAAGFDQDAIDILAGLFGLAMTGWARILERAADQTQAEIPTLPLTAAALVATIQMPSAWITRRIESKQEREAVQAIFDEYQTTGQVQRNQPAEVKSVSVERQRDRDRDRERTAKHHRQPVDAPPVVAPLKPPVVAPLKPAVASPTGPPTLSAQIKQSKPVRPARQPRLGLTDDLVDAPSIGPKTAKRFAAIGITTVQQFLNASPEQLEASLKTSWITTPILREWQAQASLVCAIPSLCGYKSQLLVGVGCTTPDSLAGKHAADLHADISRFAQSSAGKRILRSNKMPTVDDVQAWITDAGELVPTRLSA